ncbi:MAG: DUF5685 family protein [Firmicutes bacterium]|nr:DUF5685 family protein [Bacillota bacterium]
MFGYILPDIDKLSPRDFVFFKAVYCGICKSIGERLGTLARFSTGYDMTFLCILLANAMGVEFGYHHCRCMGSPKKHGIASGALVDKIADLSVLLAYHKLQDDIADGEGKKAFLASKLFFKAYQRAAASSPTLDTIVCERLWDLQQAEQNKEASVDKVAHHFASLTSDVCRVLCGDKCDEIVEKLAYGIGKFVYLMDALDDMCSDFCKGEYNVFLQSNQAILLPVAKERLKKRGVLWKDGLPLCSEQKCEKILRQVFFETCKEEIVWAIQGTVARVVECFDKTCFEGSFDLLCNIVYQGLFKKYEQVLHSDKALPRHQAAKDMRYPKSKIKEYNKQAKRHKQAAVKGHKS